MALDKTAPILIVDDHMMMVDLIRGLVRALGFAEVDYALDGDTALRLMGEKSYGLVISDLKMEPMGGLQLLRTVRAQERLQTTRFLLTTADRDAAYVLAAKNAGVDAYLLKPFTVAQLQAALERLR